MMPSLSAFTQLQNKTHTYLMVFKHDITNRLTFRCLRSLYRSTILKVDQTE